MINKLSINQELSLSLLFLSINNIITGISNKESLLYYGGYVVPFLALFIYLFFRNSKISKSTISLVLFFISIIVLLSNGISDYSSYFVFLASISSSIKKQPLIFLMSIIYISCVIFKFTLLDAPVSRMGVYINAIWFFTVIHFKVLHKSKESFRLDIYNEDIDKYIIDAMIYYLEGSSWNENPVTVERSITGKYLRDQITKQYKEMGFSNISQFAYYIGIMQNREKIEKKEITS